MKLSCRTMFNNTVKQPTLLKVFVTACSGDDCDDRSIVGSETAFARARRGGVSMRERTALTDKRLFLPACTHSAHSRRHETRAKDTPRGNAGLWRSRTRSTAPITSAPRSVAISEWPDDVLLSGLEPLFACQGSATAAPMSGRILIETNNPSSPTRPAIGSNLIESLAFLAAAGGYCPAGVRGTHETKSTGNSALMGVDGFCPNRNRNGYLLDCLFCDRSNGHVF